MNKLHYKPNNEEITQIGKILLDSKINHLKAINDNLNKGSYYKAKKVSCNNKITTIKENIQVRYLQEGIVKTENLSINIIDGNYKKIHRGIW